MKLTGEVLAGALAALAVFGVIALALFLTGCGGAPFEEALFTNDAGIDAAPAEGVKASLPDATPDASDAPPDAAPALADASSADADAGCDCFCLAMSIDPTAYCEGGVWQHCANTPAGPLVTCVPE